MSHKLIAINISTTEYALIMEGLVLLSREKHKQENLTLMPATQKIARVKINRIADLKKNLATQIYG